MSNNSLNNPYSEKTDLSHGVGCSCHSCSTTNHTSEENITDSNEKIVNRAV